MKIGIESLERELVGERAGAIGRIARRMQTALANLREFDAAGGTDAAARGELFAIAAEAVWFYVVQREALGWNRHDDALRFYDVPAEMRAHLGPRPARGGAR